jgi:hypothetical protein
MLILERDTGFELDGEKMTSNEFINELYRSPEDYESFHSIPVEHRSQETVVTWMKMQHIKLDISSIDTLRQVPADLKTEQVLLMAVKIDPEAIGIIKPSESDDYLALVLDAVNRASAAFLLMDDSYKTEEVLDAFIADKVFFDLDFDHINWVLPLLNQERIDKISAYSFWFATTIGLEKVSWPVVREWLKKDIDQYSRLDASGQLCYLSKMLKENEWPKSEGKLSYRPLKNLADGVTRFMRSPAESDFHYLYKAYVLTFPVEEVIAAMKTPTRRKMLMELYPMDVLLQHSQGDRDLRGRILEQEMGL